MTLYDGADNDTPDQQGAGDDGFVNTFGLDAIAGDEATIWLSRTRFAGDVLNGGGNLIVRRGSSIRPRIQPGPLMEYSRHP